MIDDKLEDARRMERDAIVNWLRHSENNCKSYERRNSFFEKLRMAIRARKLPERKGLSLTFLKVCLFDYLTIAATYGAAADLIERGDHLRNEK